MEPFFCIHFFNLLFIYYTFFKNFIQLSRIEEFCFNKFNNKDFTFYNPRRTDWDSSWSHNSHEFNTQVDWELDHLEKADLIIMRLIGTSTSVISMLELGLFARSGKLKVYCENGFWRKGNVDIVAKRYGVTLLRSEEEIIQSILCC